MELLFNYSALVIAVSVIYIIVDILGGAELQERWTKILLVVMAPAVVPIKFYYKLRYKKS